MKIALNTPQSCCPRLDRICNTANHAATTPQPSMTTRKHPLTSVETPHHPRSKIQHAREGRNLFEKASRRLSQSPLFPYSLTLVPYIPLKQWILPQILKTPGPCAEYQRSISETSKLNLGNLQNNRNKFPTKWHQSLEKDK